MRTSVVLISFTLQLLARKLVAFDTNISVHNSGSLRARSGSQQMEMGDSHVSASNNVARHGRSRIKHFMSNDISMKDATSNNISKNDSDLRLGQSKAERIILGAKPAANASAWKCKNICVRCSADNEQFMVQIKRSQTIGQFFKHIGRVVTFGVTKHLGGLPDECGKIKINGLSKGRETIQGRGVNEGEEENLKAMLRKNYMKLYAHEPYHLYQQIGRGACGGVGNLEQFFFKKACQVTGGMYGVASKHGEVGPSYHLHNGDGNGYK